MIMKERGESLKFLEARALFDRISPNHPEAENIQKNFANQSAGQHGEQYVDQITSSFNSPDFHTFRNLTLPVFNETIQLDQLHLTQSFALIIEIKNMVGELFFDQYAKQLIRTKKDQVDFFSDPVFQIERQEEGLKILFEEMKIELPVYKIIVFTSSNVKLDTHPEHRSIFDRICRVEQLTFRMRKLLRENNERILSKSKLEKLMSKLLSMEHIAKWKSPLARYHLKEENISGGVRCETCMTLTMVRKVRTWVCSTCRNKDAKAHMRALHDYFCLFGPAITVKQASSFLQIKSTKNTRMILKSMNLKTIGKTNPFIYLSPIHKPKDKNLHLAAYPRLKKIKVDF